MVSHFPIDQVFSDHCYDPRDRTTCGVESVCYDHPPPGEGSSCMSVCEPLNGNPCSKPNEICWPEGNREFKCGCKPGTEYNEGKTACVDGTEKQDILV